MAYRWLQSGRWLKRAIGLGGAAGGGVTPAQGTARLLDQFPGVVLDGGHDAGSLVETLVVVGRHIEDAVGARQVLRALQGVTQGAAEFDRARFGFFQGKRKGVAEQYTSIPSVAAEGTDAALAIGGFIFGHVFQC